jgi:hypothetical protein
MLYFEVRVADDLPYFKKLIRFGKIMDAVDCLVIDCFYDFGHYKNMFKAKPYEMEENHKKWTELAEVISSGSRYEKLALGACGLRSLYLPKPFISAVFDGFV